ncbi:MAG TPA: hypothetical protein VIL18_06930 [Longimicrobiales bacterium]
MPDTLTADLLHDEFRRIAARTARVLDGLLDRGGADTFAADARDVAFAAQREIGGQVGNLTMADDFAEAEEYAERTRCRLISLWLVAGVVEAVRCGGLDGIPGLDGVPWEDLMAALDDAVHGFARDYGRDDADLLAMPAGSDGAEGQR